jgi:hypothetical protein
VSAFLHHLINIRCFRFGTDLLGSASDSRPSPRPPPARALPLVPRLLFMALEVAGRWLHLAPPLRHAPPRGSGTRRSVTRCSPTRPPGNRVLVEIACTRGSTQLFAVRQAYHDRFKHLLEEDVAAHATRDFRKVMPSYLASFVSPQSVATHCNLLLNHCTSC